MGRHRLDVEIVIEHELIHVDLVGDSGLHEFGMKERFEFRILGLQFGNLFLNVRAPKPDAGKVQLLGV